MKRITVSLLLGILLAAVIVAPVLAGYYANLTVVEANGNAYTQVGLVEDADVSYLADNGYISSTGLDTRVTSSGTAIPHMLVDDSVMFVIDVEAYGTLNLLFETGETALSSFPVIVGDGGYVTVSDHANLELGDDFEVEFDGYVAVYTSDPAVTSTATSTEDAQTTSHDIDMPSGVEAGDLLLLVASAYAVNVDWTVPSGWTELDSEYSTSCDGIIAYKIADGGEGATETGTTDESAYSAHQTFRITNYVGVPEVNSAVNAASANPNSGSLSPSWGEVGDTLWFSVFAARDGAANTVSSYPTNYNDNQAYVASAAGFAQVGVATRTIEADSEDPGAYTISGALDRWIAWTIAVRGSYPLVEKEDSFSIFTDDGDIRAKLIGGSTLTVATTQSSSEYKVNVWADTSNFGIDIDDSTEDTTALAGVSANDNANAFIATPIYWDYYTHTTSSTLRITYAPDSIIVGTTLPNEENPGTYDGTVTWGSNPAGVTVTLGGLISDEQLLPAGSGADFPEPQDIAGPSGQPGMTADVGTLTTNPLYPVVSTISDTTGLPVGIVWVMGATFILAILFVWMIGDQQMMHQMFIGLAGGGWVAFCWHLGIYPFWVIFIYAVLAIAIVIGERSPTIS